MVLVLAKENEGFIEFGIGITLAHLRRHDIEERCIVDGDLALVGLLFLAALTGLLSLVQFGHQSLQLITCGLEAECSERHLEV